MRTKPTDTAYCESCACYVPQDVHCADAECPIEGSITEDEGDEGPLDFRQYEGLRETDPEDIDEVHIAPDEEESLLREIYRSHGGHDNDEDSYSGC